MDSLGPWYRNRYDSDQGLPWSKYPDFFRTAGLSGEPMQSLPFTEWVELLSAHGLLFIGAAWLPGPVGGHVRVLEGIRGDGNIGTTYMMIIDPWRGRRYTETLQLFFRIYEDGAKDKRIGNSIAPRQLWG